MNQMQMAKEKIAHINATYGEFLTGTVDVEWQKGVGGRVIMTNGTGWAYLSPRTNWAALNAYLYGFLSAMEVRNAADARAARMDGGR